jgi:hypothetical protein
MRSCKLVVVKTEVHKNFNPQFDYNYAMLRIHGCKQVLNASLDKRQAADHVAASVQPHNDYNLYVSAREGMSSCE